MYAYLNQTKVTTNIRYKGKAFLVRLRLHIGVT
jgi:hypothetical protein